MHRLPQVFEFFRAAHARNARVVVLALLVNVRAKIASRNDLANPRHRVRWVREFSWIFAAFAFYEFLCKVSNPHLHEGFPISVNR